MLVETYRDFNKIPKNKALFSRFPVHGGPEFTSFLKNTKKVEVVWFCGTDGASENYISCLTVKKKGSFKKGRFITNVVYSGDGDALEGKKRFLDEVIKVIRKQQICDWIGQGANWALFDVVPSEAVFAPFGTYRIHLSGKNEDEIFSALNRKVRQYINRGKRNENLEIRISNTIQKAELDVINEVLRNGNLEELTEGKAQLLVHTMRDKIKVYSAYLNDEPVASLVVYYNELASFAAFSGRKYNLPQEVIPFMYWTIIQDSLDSDFEYFDFVGALVDPEPGTKAHGIQGFKAKYADFVQGFLWKCIINKRKHLMFQSYRGIKNTASGKKWSKPEDIIDHERERLNIK